MRDPLIVPRDVVVGAAEDAIDTYRDDLTVKERQQLYVQARTQVLFPMGSFWVERTVHHPACGCVVGELINRDIRDRDRDPFVPTGTEIANRLRGSVLFPIGCDIDRAVREWLNDHGHADVAEGDVVEIAVD
jgi:hypothetical protein